MVPRNSREPQERSLRTKTGATSRGHGCATACTVVIHTGTTRLSGSAGWVGWLEQSAAFHAA